MSEREVSRAQRYAKAMGTPLPQPIGKRIRRIEAVMAVADADIAQVQDEAEGWAESHAEAFSAWHEALARAEKAEAEVERLRAYIEREGEKVAQLRDEWLQSSEALVRKVMRVEALCESAEQNFDEPRLWASAIRTALA